MLILLASHSYAADPGWEERGPSWAKWLSASVRMRASGTMCHYDPETNYMYIITAGHLFGEGYQSAKHLKENPRWQTIEVFYHNDVKLKEPDIYRGQVLCSIWDGHRHDVALVRFQPKWSTPYYLPIAPLNYRLSPGKMYHSTGCDERTEVAHYLVQFQEERGTGDVTDIVTCSNAPRGGRSGGGAFSDEGYLVFLCSRSQQDTGNGYWTSLKQIHSFLKEEGYGFVLEDNVPLAARKIPIVNQTGDQKDFPEDYIPLPGGGRALDRFQSFPD